MYKALRLGLLQAVTVVSTAFFASTQVQAQIIFDSDGLPGTGLSNPTSLEFGPDGRLYVSQQNGEIKAYTLTRNGPADYTIDSTEDIDLVKNGVPNNNDDGTPNATNIRQVTGVMVVGTASNPILYVTSSDWRIAVGNDTGLDTNSGVISRLTCTGGISGGSCQAWDHVDIVRGLPRSEENHATNGMDLDESTNILYVMSGGHANKGAPGNNFSGTPEYFLSAAMLAVDLDAIEQIEIANGGPFVDQRTGAQFVYDLVTLDDPTRPNIDNSDPDFPYAVGHPYYTLEIDPGDPFGGNNSLNQAIPVPGGPVQIQSPGYRNAFDVVVTESGRIYTWDNGPNTGWGGLPLVFESDGTPKGTGPFNAGAGDYCTNDFNESGSSGHGDALHDATVPGYYGGHPAPVRAFPGGTNVVNYVESGTWNQVGPTYSIHERLPAGYDLTAADFPDNPVECDYLADDPAKVLEVVSASTNGLTEYTATNFAGEMQGDLLAASFNGNIYRCKPNGPSSLEDLPGSEAGLGAGTGDCEVLFGGFGNQPLDVTTQGDSDPFPGTVWAAVYGPNTIYVFEPNDFLVCDPTDPLLDGDGDGFTNGDEADNGTDPCSGGSQPTDNDGDFVSDLNDNDDDNDGDPDSSDPMALDASNGLDTTLPLNYPFFGNDPGSGLFGLGFTGLMIDESAADTWLDHFDPEKLAAGGAAGLMSVEEVTPGDAFQTNNDQDNGFLFGIDADSTSPPFTIHSRVVQPFFGIGGSPTAPVNFQSFGIFIGTGEMDNYLKLVVAPNGGNGGFQVGTEISGSFSSSNFNSGGWGGSMLSAPSIDLFLTVEPQTSLVQASISIDEGATVFDLGTPFPIPAAWLDPADDQGLAVGLISTANGGGSPAPSFQAVWDFINIELAAVTEPGAWSQIDDQFDETRHEGGFVQAGDNFYVLGGRESTAVRIYNPATDTWSTGADSPILLHHFQAVEYDGLIYVIGAMTGTCCAEPEAPNVYIYDPVADTWITGPEMPAGRERGGAGAAVYNGKIYLVSGNTNGHSGPVSALVDVFDPATGEFSALPDIPNPRDHFFVTVANDKLYAVGGRISDQPNIFDNTVAEVDVLDLGSETWSTLPNNLPTPRAAAPTGLVGNEIVIAGGESDTRSDAHPETEALDLTTETWRNLTNMLTPRHATQAIVSNNGFYVAAGSPDQGGPGSAELDLEALYLFGQTAPGGAAISASSLGSPVTLDFGGVQSGSNTSDVVLLDNSGGDQGIVIEDVAITGGGAFALQSPWANPVVIAPGDNLQISLSFSPAAVGADSDTLVVTHSGGQLLNIALQGEGLDEPVALFRVNAGGPEVAASDAGPVWSEDSDNGAGQSPYLANDTNLSGHGVPTSRDASVPAYVPDAIYATERWDAPAAPNMVWNFPVTSGETYVVRLYLMNGFDGTNAAGDRIFDIQIEGQALSGIQDIDLSATYGDQVAAAYEETVEVTDSTLTITFLGQVENPLVNGIEILSLGVVAPNEPPVITPIATQFSIEGEDIDFTLLASDNDGPGNITFGATGLPPGLTVLDPTNGFLGGVIDAGASSGSPYAVTVTAFDGADTTELEFDWIVTEATVGPEVLYRINVGGAQVAAQDASLPDWAVDTAAAPSAFRVGTGGDDIYTGNSGGAYAGPIIMTDPSIPPSAPAAIFNFERYDVAAGDDFIWAFPVPDGALIEVRLFFAELFSGIDAAGERVFSVDVEGGIPADFTDLDPFALAGAKGGYMASTTLTMGDGTLDIEFVPGVENPALKGIEIIQLDAVINTPPQVPVIADQAVTEGDVLNLPFGIVDPDGDSLTITAPSVPDASGFSTLTVLENAPGDYSVDLDFAPQPGDAGTYTFTVTADDSFAQPTAVFDLTVSEAGNIILHRINVGGPQIAAADASAPDWSIDTDGTPSALRIGAGGGGVYNGNAGSAHAGAIVMTDPSIPAAAPAALFNTERFDPPADPEMIWALPVVNGTTVEVRLYFAELFGGITAAGQRIFDVNVEGSVPAAFDNLDAFATAGAKGAFMRSATVVMADDTLDLTFISDVQSPALKGIEVIQLDVSNNTPPDVTNPGDQANTEGDVVSLPIAALDVDPGTVLSYSATNLPPDLVINPSTGEITGTVSEGGGGDAFLEVDGLVVIEMESAESIPANWVLEDDLTGFANSTGDGYLRYTGSNQFNNPGVDILTYEIEIQTPGTYRVQWRSAFGTGMDGAEHNDSWLKVNADAFYGEQGDGDIVCPKGYIPAQNDCPVGGVDPAGAGSGGWFKAYRSGGQVGIWAYTTNTSDFDAHQIYARFDNPGLYTIEVSGRSQDHLIDRLVLFKDDYVGDPLDTANPESVQNGPGAADGSPYATEVTVSDGIAPVVVAFEWVVTPIDFVPEPRAQISITPTGGLTASTFSSGSIAIENISTGGQQIESVTIDLSTGLFQDIVWDPAGAAGDALGKPLTPDSGAVATGYVVPANPAGTPPFSQPHNGLIDNSDGFDVVTLEFTDFDPGEIFTFSVDIDPTSIKDATGTGEAGSVSGLELSGASVEVAFDDLSVLLSELFYDAATTAGVISNVTPAIIDTPVLSLPGATLDPTTLSPDHTAAVIPAGQALQTLEISGPVGATVRLLQIEGALLADFGYDLEAFEANEALAVSEFTAIIGPGGTVEIPVTLTRSDLIDGGFNYFSAVIEQDGVTGPSSNFIVLELDSGLPNVAPVAGNDFGTVDVGGTLDISLLANDSDSDGTLDVSSILIVDQPTHGTLTPGVLGVYTYSHDGLSDIDDSFTYTVNDNDGAPSNLATVNIKVGIVPDLPDDVDGDGIDNATDNDDDNDGFLDTYDPFAIDADNGITTNLPLTLELFSDQPGTGLFGLGFTGLMSNGDITAAIPVEGDDYQDLYDVAQVFIDDNPANGGVLTLIDVDAGDAFQGNNTQTHAFQVGLNVDTDSDPFVVHSRILAPWFDDVTTNLNFLSEGMFIGTGDQDNYLKMVFARNTNNIELLLEENGGTSAEKVGSNLTAASELDLFLLVDPATNTAQAQLSIDGAPLVNIGAVIDLPPVWLDPADDFGLAMGLISTSFGGGAPFDANFDLLEAYFLATDDAFDALEDDALTSLDVLANDHVDPDLFILAVGATDSGGTAVLNDNGTPLDTSDDVIDYTPAADFFGVETFTYTVEDGNGLQSTAVVAVDVAQVNDAPTVGLAGDQGALEDAGAQTLPAFATFDAGAGETQSNLGFDVTNDNNALFATQPSIDLTGTLSWESAVDANGSATVTVVAQDDGGTANGGQDLSGAQQFTITVTAVNDAPSVTIGGDQTVSEDAGAQTVVAFATGFAPGGGSDEVAQTIAAFAVNNDNNGLFSAQPSIDTAGDLSFTPAAGANGVAVVSVQVQDNGGTSDGGIDVSGIQTFSITIDAINDAPSVTLAGNQLVLEDAGAQLVAGFASAFDPGMGEGGQLIADFLVGNDNPTLFAVAPDVANDGTLSFTPAADANGVAIVGVQVQDDGGTANGGTDTSAIQNFTITVTSVNDAPAITIGSDQQVDEDAGAQVVAAFASGFAPGGGVDEAGQLVADYLVGNDNPTLFSSAPDIANDGTLSYTPADGVSGSAVVSVQVQDDGGTSDGGVDVSAIQTFSITVNAVNDAPSVVLAGNQSLLEDAGAQVVAGFASAFDPGMGEGGQLIADFLVGNNNPTLFAAAPDVANDGTLSYTPADDANGVAIVSVQVQDDGGTANGGTDTSAIQNFTITVTSVNDAPAITIGSDQQVDEDAGAQVVAAFASGFAPGGGADEAGQLVADYLVGNDNPTLFSSAPDIANDGTLSYTPADGVSGSAVVSVQVQDDGGTSDGGVDVSAIQTFSITVNAVNDAPSVVLAGNQSLLEDAGAQVVAGFASAFDPGMGEGGQLIADFLVGNNNPTLFAAAPDVANDGTLSYTPADDANGVAIVSVQVQDDGGTANGGTDTSAIQNFTITVTSVNDAPAITIGSDQQVDEDAGAQVVAAFASGFAPGGGADEAGQLVADYLVGNDNPTLFSAAPDIANDGTLSYTPADGVSGSAVVSVQVQDDGGTSDGGVDLSTVQTFTISVADVNDAPTVDLAGDQSVNEDAGAQTVADFATGFNPGEGEDEQALVTYLVSNDNNGLFTGQPGITNDGRLTYTPADDANGVAVVSVQVQDDGGTANGGVDTSALQTFSITVLAVNDAPGFQVGSDQTVELDAGLQLVEDFAGDFAPGGGPDEAGQAVSAYVVDNDNASLFEVEPSISVDGVLTYASAEGEFGTAIVSVQVQDDGGTDNGGQDTSEALAFSITVNPETVAPSITGVDTVAGTADGVLLSNEATPASITQLLIGFSEDVAAGNGTDPDNYRVFAAGDDGLFSSSGCSIAAGDDVAISVDNVAWVGSSNTAALAINGGVDLEQGNYLLVACDTIEDAVGNTLENNFSLSFQVTRTNGFANPNFDNDLGEWVPDAMNWSVDDADEHQTSGSALWERLDGAAGVGIISQCVTLDQSGSFSVSGLARVSSVNGSVALEVMTDAYNDENCAGTLLDTEMLDAGVSDTDGAWQAFTVSGSTPAISRSVMVNIISSNAPGDQASVGLDNLFIESSSVLFKDGFEGP